MNEKNEIIVIGAGLAGLAVARELHLQGYRVLVLESRDRIGGRIWTSDRWSDLPLDLGASWIHGTVGNPITKLARQSKAKLVETSYDRNIIYLPAGEELAGDDEARLNKLKAEVHRTLRAAQETDHDASVRKIFDQLSAKYGNTEEIRILLNFVLSGEIEQEYVGSGEALSSHWYDSAQEFDGEDALFPAGFGKVIDLLSRDLNIQTGQVVQRIDWRNETVRVFANSQTQAGDEEREFTAEKVIVTLPLGVLKRGNVQFDPVLPRSMAEAIIKLGMGVLNKCYLRFPDVFWPDDVDWLEYIPHKHGEWTQWVSFARTIGQPVLLGFNAADRGREIESWTDQQIVSSAMATLKTIFGDEIPEPLDFQITRWGSDPFSFGSYSFNSVGTEPRLRGQLARALSERLYFAGEATEQNYFGTAHGAYLSGLRAAREIH